MKSLFTIKTLNNHMVTPPPTLWQSLANLCNYKNTLPHFSTKIVKKIKTHC